MKERIRVLHVDDEPDFLDTTATFLESKDKRFSVETATGADEGLDLLSDEEYDCVVSDHVMPGKDGIEFFEAVREEYPDIPFILFTGEGSEQVASDAISAGVTEYLQKRPGTEQYDLLANRVEKAVEKRRAETNYRELFEKTQIGLTIHDPDTGVITDTNRAFADLLGYEPEELVGMHPSDFTPDDSSFSREEADRLVRQAAEEGPQTFEWRDETKDGDDIWVEVSLQRTRINGTERVLAVAKDITERKEREEEIKRYEAFVEHSSEVIAHLDEDGKLLYESSGTERVFGHEPEINLDENVFEYMHPDDRERVAQEFSEVLNDPERTAGDVELRLEDEDGDHVWIEAAGVDRTDTELGGIVVSLRDITERKEREEELERYREYTDDILDGIDDLFFVHDEEGNIQRWNDSLAEVTGYTDEEIAPMNGVDFVPEEHQEETELKIEEVLETGSARLEAPILTKEGSTIPYEFVANRVEHPDGDPRLIGVGRDLTERKEREKELERYETFIRNSSDVTTHLDEDGTILYQSPSVADVLGHKPGERKGDNAFKYVHPDDAESVTEEFSSVVEDSDKEEGAAELRYEHADGSYVWIEAVARDQTGTDIGGIVVNSRDVSERKERERELKRKNKRLNEFASVVSHDLQNPLTVAKGRLELAQREYESEHLDKVEGALDRMNTLIEDILELARGGTEVIEIETLNFEEIAEECWQNVETNDARLVTDTDLTVRADRSRLQQLLENLMRNSVKHGSSRQDADGSITVTVGDLGDKDGFYVADDGCGIPESEREKVFESGYSTSEEERGTGFGLSIVRDVAEAHGWGISVTESDSGGARFEFTGVESGSEG